MYAFQTQGFGCFLPMIWTSSNPGSPCHSRHVDEVLEGSWELASKVIEHASRRIINPLRKRLFTPSVTLLTKLFEPLSRGLEV